MNQDIEVLRILAKYDKAIEKLYNKLLYQLSKVSLNITKIREGAFFSFDDYPELKEQVNDVLNSYSKEQQEITVNGINQAVKKSFTVNQAQFGEYSRYSNQAIIDMRKTAVEAFIESRMKPEQGLSLSQKVWNYTRQGKAEFEAGVSEILEEGLLEGMSAEELGRKLRNKLKHPDMVYKRYHLKKMTAKGKKDVVEWRRKVVDKDGKVRYIKEDLEKVGRGVYRSSRKNALRLTATEINMAYRYADYIRWNSEPFVTGFRIQLSGNHTCNGKPFYDMCDDLVGVYPKTFKWSGWHPKCRCIATPILVDEKEMEKISELSELDYRNYRSPNLVKKMPKSYNEYVAKEKDRILASMDKGTTPYWVRDNYKGGDIRKKFVWERIGKTKFKTEAQKDAIQKAWDERRRKNAIEAARVKRHASRDALAIQEAWDLRKEKYAKLMKTAQNVNMGAYGETWVDRTNLKWLINKKKYHLLEAEYRKVAKELSLANKRKKQLSTLIPDVDDWSQQFSYEELKAVFDSVEKKLAQWSSMTLEQQQKKLMFEIVDYLGGNMGGVQQKYSTWKVSQAAYKKQVEKVNTAIYKKTVEKDVATFITWTTNHPKATGVYKKVMELVDMLQEDELDLKVFKQKFGDTKSHIKQLEKEAAQRAAKKSPKVSVISDNGSAYIGGSPYTPEELKEIARLEKGIFDYFHLNGFDKLLNLQSKTDFYSRYLLNLSEKYYAKQASILSASEIEDAKEMLTSYLRRTPKNPNYVWGSALGGEHPTMYYDREKLAKMLNDVSREELSLVTRFTQGMTFSNSYILRHQSPYWKKIWTDKLLIMKDANCIQEMIDTIEEYEGSINYILNKMHRYDGYVFRGLKDGGADEVLGQLKAAWNSDKIWENIAPASSSTSLKIARSFDNGSQSSLILIIRNKTGVNIQPISEYSDEREIMLLKNRKYKVVKEPYKVGYTNIVELEEIIE